MVEPQARHTQLCVVQLAICGTLVKEHLSPSGRISRSFPTQHPLPPVALDSRTIAGTPPADSTTNRTGCQANPTRKLTSNPTEPTERGNGQRKRSLVCQTARSLLSSLDRFHVGLPGTSR